MLLCNYCSKVCQKWRGVDAKIVSLLTMKQNIMEENYSKLYGLELWRCLHNFNIFILQKWVMPYFSCFLLPRKFYVLVAIVAILPYEQTKLGIAIIITLFAQIMLHPRYMCSLVFCFLSQGTRRMLLLWYCCCHRNGQSLTNLQYFMNNLFMKQMAINKIYYWVLYCFLA